MASDYTYPDTKDCCVDIAVRYEPYSGYWEQSEIIILEHASKRLAVSNATCQQRSIFDAGCGDGRLLKHFAPLFGSIVAIDPDPVRLGKAAETAKREGFACKSTFENVSLEEYSTAQRYDFVLCSHVIEHVHTFSLGKILESLGQLLLKKGVLLITTSHSRNRDEHFTKITLHNGAHREEVISEATFNNLATEKSFRSDTIVLPIHKLTRKALYRMLNRVGVKIDVFKVYHELDDFGDLDNHFHRDWFINLHRRLQDRYGHDMAAICCCSN